MSIPETWPQQFRRAYELAYFLHPEKTLAVRIAAAALSKLEVAASAQAKRLYYHSHSQDLRVPAVSKEARFRTKVSFEELPLLQRLIYIESEAHERAEEGASGASLSADAMTIRFVKHLVQITLKRNSFYVTLGISRVLHNYSTAETMRIYDAILDDSNRVKDDDYFRSRKSVLMQELKDRFGESIRIWRGPHGEDRFESHPLPNELAPVVRESLNHFVPWETSCVSPSYFQPEPAAISATSNAKGGVRDGHRIEVERMHAILHPDCYARLLAALRLDSSERRVEVPRFRLARASDESGSGGDRDRPPHLAEEELAAVGAQLAGEASRRRAFSAGLIRILVDGLERARFDTREESAIRIELEPEADLLEVLGRGPEGELRLASHLFSGDERSENRFERVAVTLEGGQRLSFECERQTNAEGQAVGLTVQIRYRETSLLRAASLWLRRLLSPTSRRPLLLRPEIAFALLLLGAAGIFVYSESRRIEPKPPTPALGAQGPVAPVAAPGSNAARLPVAGSQPAPRLPAETLAQERPHSPESARSRQRAPSETIETRGLEARPHSLSLHDVRKILVEWRDDHLRQGFIQKLRATGRFQVVDNPESADAVLRVSESKPRAAGSRIRVAMHLVGPDGKILWPSPKASSRGRYAGSAEEIATASVRDLLDATHPQKPVE